MLKSQNLTRGGLHNQFLVGVAACLLTLANLCHAAAMVGKPAPPFTAVDLQQRPVNLAHLRGQTVLVMFWATWCAPCRKEMPEVQAVYKKYEGKGFEVIAVNVSDEREDVEDYVKKMGLELHVVMDPEGDTAQRFGVMGLPTNYVIDGSGMVVEEIIGGKLTSEVLEEILKKHSINHR